MQRLRVLVPLLLVLVAVPAAPAAADGRRAADRFGAAALRAQLAARELRPEVLARLETIDTRRCLAVLRKAPPRAQFAGMLSFVAATSSALLLPMQPVLEGFVAELDGVQTRDRALVRGRAAWRTIASQAAELSEIPDPCGALEAWQAGGWRREDTPVSGPWMAFLRLNQGLDGRLHAAARRLRRLGVSRLSADRFSGDTLFDGVLTKAEEANLLGSS